VHRRRVLLGLAASIATLVGIAPQEAYGEDASNAVAAQVLFDDALKLMANGDYAAACPKLAESKRLALGIGVCLYLGECEERTGRLATAWAAFREAEDVATTKQDPRARVAHQRLQRLEPRLSRITFEVPSPTPSDLQVQLDTTGLGPATWGTAVPVNPGAHTLVVSASGRRTFTQVVEAPPEGQSVTVRIPPGERTGAIINVAPPHGEPAVTEARSTWTTQRWWGVGVGAIGVLGIGLGTVFGVQAKVDYDLARIGCAGSHCSQAGVDLGNEAYALGNVSTVAFTAGAALLAAGIVLFATAPSAAPRRSSSGAAWRMPPVEGSGVGAEGR
jgi:hypothetical protein